MLKLPVLYTVQQVAGAAGNAAIAGTVQCTAGCWCCTVYEVLVLCNVYADAVGSVIFDAVAVSALAESDVKVRKKLLQMLLL